MRNSEVVVTVIMPCYNYGRYIQAAVDSVRQQTLQDWRLVIVNDGSTDDTAERLTKFENDPKITVINKANGGVSSARNAGLDEATSEFVAFLDADDIWLPDKLERVVTQMQAHDAKFGASNFSRFSSTSEDYGNFLSYCKQLQNKQGGAPCLVVYPALPLFTQTLEMPWYPSANIVHKDFYSTERFDTSMKIGEDLDFFVRCWDRYKGIFVFDEQLKLRVHDANASKDSPNHVLLVLKIFTGHLHRCQSAVSKKALEERIDQLLCHQGLLDKAINHQEKSWLRKWMKDRLFTSGFSVKERIKLYTNFLRLSRR